MKVVPMGLLIVVALFGGLPPMIVAAFGACAVGDWFLAWQGEFKPFMIDGVTYSAMMLICLLAINLRNE